MSTAYTEQEVIKLIENFNQESFIYDLLLAYGVSKTSITRLQKGDFNLSKNKGEVLYKKKVFFKKEEGGKLLSTIDEVVKEDRVYTLIEIVSLSI